MTAKDQLKLLNKGITIIRAEILGSKMRIKVKNHLHHEWKTWKDGYTSKSALRKDMDTLLKTETIIED